MKGLNLILKLEEFLEFLLAIFAFSFLDFEWWWFPALILAPDIGMLGYLIDNRAGAITYNILHSKSLAIMFYILGWYLGIQILMLAGIIMFGHAALDRVFGYGLKYFKGFKYTHLGELNNGKANG